MTLEDYYKEKYPNMKPYAADAAFAQAIHVARQSVSRYRLFLHYPRPEIIAKIRSVTKGLVDANDLMAPSLRRKAKA